jgi:hypothetical protein
LDRLKPQLIEDDKMAMDIKVAMFLIELYINMVGIILSIKYYIKVYLK